MNTVVLNPYNETHRSIVNSYEDIGVFQEIMNISNYYSQEKYQQEKIISNKILECLLELDGKNIKNYCLYSGMKDNRLIQMKIANLTDEKFLKKAMDYAFLTLNAYTLAIFTEQGHSSLEKYGFENLGQENGIITYIKEKENYKERVRK